MRRSSASARDVSLRMKQNAGTLLIIKRITINDAVKITKKNPKTAAEPTTGEEVSVLPAAPYIRSTISSSLSPSAAPLVARSAPESARRVCASPCVLRQRERERARDGGREEEVVEEEAVFG